MSLQANLVFSDFSVDNPSEKIRFLHAVCSGLNHDYSYGASCSFEHDGIVIHVNGKSSVEEILINYFREKEFLNKRDADMLKVYIAALVAYIGNTNGEYSPDMEEAKNNAPKICHPSLNADVVREAITRLSKGEFNP